MNTSSFSSHEGYEKIFISPTSSFPSLEIPLFLYLFVSRKTHLLTLYFFFIAIGSRSLLGVFLSPNFMSYPPEKSLLNSKKPIHAYHVRTPIFSKKLLHPYFNSPDEFLSFSKSYQFQIFFSFGW